MTIESKPIKVIIFTNADWHFYAHLLPIALNAKERGYDVTILTHISLGLDNSPPSDAGLGAQESLEALGSSPEGNKIKIIPITINRSSLNPFTEILLLFNIIRILRREKPDILHNFTIKPIVYGSIAGFFCKIPQVINTFLGLGTLFIGDSVLIRGVRGLVCSTLGFISKRKKMVFITQNKDDEMLLVESMSFPRRRESRIKSIADSANWIPTCAGMTTSYITTQCSVGIPTQEFDILPQPKGPIVFALVARMLVDKGVREFIEAAKLLDAKGVDAEFWLVGEPDKGNKSSLSEEELAVFPSDQVRAKQEGDNKDKIKYLGYTKDIKSIWKRAHVAVLPSYREGLSRSLLEAGAYGRAVITTDAPGGRELVQDSENGLLVKPRDAKSLADAMELLAKDDVLRKRLAKKIRQDILKHYDSKIIAAKMVDFYDKI